MHGKLIPLLVKVLMALMSAMLPHVVTFVSSTILPCLAVSPRFQVIGLLRELLMEASY